MTLRPRDYNGRVCTMTWRTLGGGYEIFFNRDERRERKPACAPAVQRRDAVRFIAPRDGDRGGTWIAVNELGVSFCLLNGAGGSTGTAQPESPTSRGMVPLSLVAAGTVDLAALALRELKLSHFRPFVIVVLAPGARGLVGHWSGRSLDLRMALPPDQPLVSSSFCDEQVRMSRVAVFERMAREAGGAGTAFHLDYHRRHEPERGPNSPCMHRSDARTVSFSWLAVDDSEVRFHYAGDAPCRAEPGPPTTLARRQ